MVFMGLLLSPESDLHLFNRQISSKVHTIVVYTRIRLRRRFCLAVPLPVAVGVATGFCVSFTDHLNKIHLAAEGADGHHDPFFFRGSGLRIVDPLTEVSLMRWYECLEKSKRWRIVFETCDKIG